MLWLLSIAEIPLLLIDTTGCDMPELVSSDEISKANEGEVALTCIHVDSLVRSGLDPREIAVITPYNLQAQTTSSPRFSMISPKQVCHMLQVELIRLQLSSKYPGLEIRSVDGFQGREKEAVVLSLVRSNECGEVGFLSERRRLNVAVTRARRHCAVICNVETVSHDAFLRRFAEYMQEKGEVRTAVQYQNQMDSLRLHRPEGMELTVRDSDTRYDASSRKMGDKKREKNKLDPKRQQQKAARKEKAPSSQSEPPHPTEIKKDKETKREEFLQTVNGFLGRESEQVLRFPPELNSHDRLVIHEIAEGQTELERGRQAG